MERDNFYILLELSVEPPETNDTVIYEVIQKKKAEWSRLRNHPTKGIQAQKYISLIPEIQRVMMHQELRQKEALDALNILKKGKQDKFAEIDRHIDILIGKGYLLDEEIAKLADIHEIKESEIKERITAKKEKQYQKVDQAIVLRMEKGYITEAEIAKIAKRYGFKLEEVRRRVRCPIVKDDKEKIAKPPALDKSIEKSIIENLKIVQKSSLYDFLNLPETAELSLLQEKAAHKKKELTNFSRKDAEITAGNILAGQCLTIFKSNESRNAYDISLAKAKLASLHSDIDVSAIGGTIRPEYFNLLVSKAMDYGMDQEEADAYINTYCSEKNYRIEKTPHKKRSLRIITITAFVAVLIIAIGGVVLHMINEKKSGVTKYQELLARVESQPAPEKKIALLKAYADANKTSDHARDAYARITRLEKQITTREWEKVEKASEKALQNNDLEQARSLYQKFHESPNAGEARSRAADQIQKLSNQIENRDYERIMQILATGEADEKIAALQQYLDDHPTGTHRDAVNAHIQDISAEYFIFIRKQLDACEKEEDWPECIALSQAFIKHYDNSYADQLKALLPNYQERDHYDKIFEALVQKANQFGNDHAAAREVFTDFLAAYPGAPIRTDIELKITEIDDNAAAHAKAEKMALLRDLLKQSGRFTILTEGVAVDSKTRLMWSILDAQAMTPAKTCIDYEKAKTFVEDLSIGGYRDWRLPTPGELAGIYKIDPVFPVGSDNGWYWTSEHFTRYADGWQVNVSTLHRVSPAEWVTRNRDSRECGNVRAVRNP
jgi:hypothetical protein